MVADATTRFPFINLEKALARAQEIFEGDRGGRPMMLATAFELWGYSSKSSGGFQTVSALKHYALLNDDGSNSDRKVGLTRAARNYFLDERDETRKAALKHFALAPSLFRTLWEKAGWSAGVPADPVARSYLKIERGLNEQSARSLLNIFRENLHFAGLDHEAHQDEPVEADDSTQDEPTRPQNAIRNAEPSDVRSSSLPDSDPESGPRVMRLSAKPIVFDMESVYGEYSFNNSDDLADFISKLEKIKALLPSKANISG